MNVAMRCEDGWIGRRCSCRVLSMVGQLGHQSMHRTPAAARHPQPQARNQQPRQPGKAW